MQICINWPRCSVTMHAKWTHRPAIRHNKWKRIGQEMYVCALFSAFLNVNFASLISFPIKFVIMLCYIHIHISLQLFLWMNKLHGSREVPVFCPLTANRTESSLFFLWWISNFLKVLINLNALHSNIENWMPDVMCSNLSVIWSQNILILDWAIYYAQMIFLIVPVTMDGRWRFEPPSSYLVYGPPPPRPSESHAQCN